MNYFDHPYPRYGLAVVLEHNDFDSDDMEVIPGENELAKFAAEYIRFAMHKYRLHTHDQPKDSTESTLQFRYLSFEDLATKKAEGQTSANYYYLAPHVTTDDISANRLIKEARKKSETLAKGKGLNKLVKLKRSFSPFTTKLNEGTKTLSNPKGTLLQAGFTLVTTITPTKPATQVDFSNQVMIPDLPVEDLIEFIRLFDQMQSKETENRLIRELKAGNKNYRPPIYEGNYPDAPPSPIFGPLGLIGAMGQWAKKAELWDRTEKILEKLVTRPIYLVSYNPNLFQQVHLGHHVKRLAENLNLPVIINDLYHSHFYNKELNKRGNKTRELFYEMANRFMQFYTDSSFKDFLAFRLEYPHTFSSILKDYFMENKKIPKEIVKSAQQFGSYLNKVAFIIGKHEVENKNTNRDLYEAKANILAQLESTTISCKNTTSLFAQLNVQAGRMSNMDVPSKASRFIEATNTGEITLDQARDLILAYMRLRSDNNNKEDSAPSPDGTFSTSQ